MKMWLKLKQYEKEMGKVSFYAWLGSAIVALITLFVLCIVLVASVYFFEMSNLFYFINFILFLGLAIWVLELIHIFTQKRKNINSFIMFLVSLMFIAPIAYLFWKNFNFKG